MGCIVRKGLFFTNKNHEYVEVYDTTYEEFFPEGLSIKRASDIDVFKTKKNSLVYVKSVCKYCGNVIER